MKLPDTCARAGCMFDDQRKVFNQWSQSVDDTSTTCVAFRITAVIDFSVGRVVVRLLHAIVAAPAGESRTSRKKSWSHEMDRVRRAGAYVFSTVHGTVRA